MIVKNEQACIEDCLKSLKGIDEIVILDTGSTDRTPEICRQYTDKVYVGEYEWRDHFAEARNESLKRCSGDWIFIIDADERLVTGAESLRAAVENSGGETVLMTQINCGSVEFFYPRLFKNHVGIHWQGAIHNYLNRTGTKKTSVVIECGSSENHAKDPDRALRILRKEVTLRPDCVREKYYLAREYYYRAEWATAVWWFESYLSKASWAPEWAEAWCLIGKCYAQLKDYGKAADACLQAIKINADFAEPMHMMAAMSGPKNKKRWQTMAEACKNEDVLFVRKINPAGVLQ
jgi:glycosyltransferase involved in cell wall biosynthesis